MAATTNQCLGNSTIARADFKNMMVCLRIDRIDNPLDRDWIGKKVLSKTLSCGQDNGALNSDIDKGLFAYFSEPGVQLLLIFLLTNIIGHLIPLDFLYI